MVKFFLIVFISISSMVAQAPDAGQPKPEDIQNKSTKPIKKISMEEAKKNTVEMPGLITLLQDTTNGKMYMLIKKEQLDKEYIHFVYGKNGQNNTGVNRGWPYSSKVIKFKRYFTRIEFEVQNNSFYFDPENPLAKSSDANISTAILASSNIISEKDGSILIGVDNIFLTESLYQISRGFIPGSSNKNPFKLGRLAKDRSKYISVKNYPENTDLIVQYVYTNPVPTNWGSDGGVTDPRSMNVSLQHSFIQMPENEYKPRMTDPRIGYFSTQITDMTVADDPTPYRDMIHRWHLEKKNPDQERSEVVQPIVWWIENTTPHEFREAIKEGVLAWNKAFEKAGFINAVEVKVQPDDAEWDAGDIRYNVLRWTSSPNPWFGGLGPSFTNPRTGQILGADIMLEYVWFTNRVKYEKLYETFNVDESMENKKVANEVYCHAGNVIQQGNQFGMIALGKAVSEFDQLEQHRLLYEGLVDLVLHEVGHTLGLNHNFFASNLHTFNTIHDRHITEPVGLYSSVMDYTPVNIGPDPKHHGQYYSTIPGPYDIWAIEFGYAPSLKNPEDEKRRIKSLMEKSTQKEYGFGNDSDDMRSPGRGLDPRIMTFDMSDDALAYAKQRMDIVRSLYPNLLKRFEVSGDSYHAFKNAFSTLNREYSSCANVISRYVGGVYIDRSMVGQIGKKEPFVPVSRDKQKWAMTLLKEYIFAPEAFEVSEEMYRHLQWERRGFSGTKDPQIHDMVLNVQKNILSQLLHPNVVKRIVNSGLYGNRYGLNEMMNDLTTACFSSDAGSNINTMRINLQTEYTKRLISVVNNKGKGKHGHVAVSIAFENLNKIKKYASRFNGVNDQTKAHRKHLIYIIDKALDT